MERPRFVDHPDPNAVLRGGPLDGGRTRVHNWVPVDFHVGDETCFYRPTGDLDAQYPTLNVYVFDHAEPA